MSNTILHISHGDRSAAILASEVRAITRLPAGFEYDNNPLPSRTRVEYGPNGYLTLPISIEEHADLVIAWVSAK